MLHITGQQLTWRVISTKIFFNTCIIDYSMFQTIIIFFLVRLPTFLGHFLQFWVFSSTCTEKHAFWATIFEILMEPFLDSFREQRETRSDKRNTLKRAGKPAFSSATDWLIDSTPTSDRPVLGALRSSMTPKCMWFRAAIALLGSWTRGLLARRHIHVYNTPNWKLN